MVEQVRGTHLRLSSKSGVPLSTYRVPAPFSGLQLYQFIWSSKQLCEQALPHHLHVKRRKMKHHEVKELAQGRSQLVVKLGRL